MKEYKSNEKLKAEFGERYDEYMYAINLELLARIDKAVEYIKGKEQLDKEVLLGILEGEIHYDRWKAWRRTIKSV